MIDNIKAILLDNSFTTESLPILESKLFFEGARRRAYLVRFVVLLFLSTIIATYGVLSDSTATVIGAMIIAPLMTPILATTAALVMGQPQRARDSATIVLGGVVLVIVVALVSGLLTDMGATTIAIHPPANGRSADTRRSMSSGGCCVRGGWTTRAGPPRFSP